MKKRLPKILTLFFLFVFALQLVGLIYLALTPEFGFAAEKQQIKFEPQVAIPGVEKINFSSENASTKPIGDYIKAIYEYGIAIVGILATVVMMIGGVMWIAAGGNASRISEAKAWIGASLTGLVLALSSYMILYTVNPDLVNFKVKRIGHVDPVSTCGWVTGSSCPEGTEKNASTECDGDPCYGLEECSAICCCPNNGGSVDLSSICCQYNTGEPDYKDTCGTMDQAICESSGVGGTAYPPGLTCNKTTGKCE